MVRKRVFQLFLENLFDFSKMDIFKNVQNRKPPLLLKEKLLPQKKHQNNTREYMTIYGKDTEKIIMMLFFKC